MIKLLGASMTAAACAWIGFQRADLLNRRCRAIRELEQSLLLLEQELELCAPPLPELMARLSMRTQGCGQRLFSACGEGLERLEELSFPQLWQQAVKACGAGQACADCLLPLGEVLGRCDAAGQIRAVAAVRGQLDHLVQLAREDCLRQGSVYRALGVSGGVFLVILLL